jgi:hypothetical protein
LWFFPVYKHVDMPRVDTCTYFLSLEVMLFTLLINPRVGLVYPVLGMLKMKS